MALPHSRKVIKHQGGYDLSARGKNIGNRWGFSFNSAPLRQRVAHVAVWLLVTEGRKSVEPAAREQGVDPGVVPVVAVHHVCVLEAVEIERLLREPADQSRLEERCPHVLEEPFGAAFVHLCVFKGGVYHYETKGLFSYDDIIPFWGNVPIISFPPKPTMMHRVVDLCSIVPVKGA